ncbi:SDR family NAD(P)-dependent oxidoreductase [Corynebacterium pilosum]|uniref:Short-chain dehydrogenase n=1 Tax=Corynebacterium pilosum TaxID=35756 RepID=A0A376CMZ8_9CORY|nr:SDR family NAD(P)-dependent oxidoreductase [Corynebacterium pilosum]STC69810.1 short-chain dehydrogenase [Corynebacterium pilosum]
MTLFETNPVAIVTGGASGLGAATATALKNRGATVVVFDLQGSIDRAREEGTAEEGITYRAVDVTDSGQVAEAVAEAAELGELRIVVACAGICPSMRIVGRKGTHSPDVFATTMNVNVMGTFHVLTEAAGHMAQLEPLDSGERGLVVMTASVAAFEGQVGQSAYAASKGAIHSLTITAARDLGSLGIRVNAVAPGIVETPMMAGISEEYRTELEANVIFPKRMARPAEFAQLVEAIAENTYLNGETIRLDGALRMPPR